MFRSHWTIIREHVVPVPKLPLISVDKKNQLDVTFFILYFSSNSCSTCFGQVRLAGSASMDALPTNRT